VFGTDGVCCSIEVPLDHIGPAGQGAASAGLQARAAAA
jgi:hypothetical protein